MGSAAARSCAMAPGVPSHRVGRLSSNRGSPRRCWHKVGRKADSAGDSARPAPGALTNARAPCRAASSTPGTPPAASASGNSSGSSVLASTRESSTSMGCKPCRVLRKSAPLRTVRSPGSTRAAEISRLSTTCSNQCGSDVPGLSRATAGAPARCGPRRWRLSCQSSRKIDRPRGLAARNASGIAWPIRRRFSTAWPMPETRAARSLITRHSPSGPRSISAA